MFFYSFYTDRYRSPENLHYRTDYGISHLRINIKLFPSKQTAEHDFFELLYDNPDYRIGEYFDTEKGKKKEKVKQEPIKSVIPPDYKLELDKVYNLDCMMFMNTLPNHYVDYIFTSPPYNVGARTSFGERNAIYKDNEEMYEEYADTLGQEEYELWLFDVIRECIRVTRRHVFFNIQMLGNNKKTVMKIFATFPSYIKDVFIWNKTIASPHINKKIPNSAYEFIFVFSNDCPEKRTFEDSNFNGKFRNVITGLNSSQNQYRVLNKATFPLYLPRIFMQNFGKKQDIWLDPFSGTGTTFHAAILEEKHFLGSETDADQCEVTNKRIFIEESAPVFDFDQVPQTRLTEVEEVTETFTDKSVVVSRPGVIEFPVTTDSKDELPFG